MPADTITLRVVRRCLVGGHPVDPGTKVEMTPLQALDAVETGRLAFVDDRDAERCMAARRKDLARQLRRVPASPDDGPWRPVWLLA